MSFFNLTARSVAQESQYLSKERRLPRTEFAPHIQLIRSSEVDPLGPSTPGASHNRPVDQTTHTTNYSPIPPTTTPTPQPAHSTVPQQPNSVYGPSFSSFPPPSPFPSSASSTRTTTKTAAAIQGTTAEDSPKDIPKGTPEDTPKDTAEDAAEEPLNEVYRAAFANLKREVRTTRRELANRVEAAKDEFRHKLLEERKRSLDAQDELVSAAKKLRIAKWKSRTLFVGMLAVTGFALLNILVEERAEKEWKRVLGERDDGGFFAEWDMRARVRAARKAAADAYAARMRTPSQFFGDRRKVAADMYAAKMKESSNEKGETANVAESENEQQTGARTGWGSWFWSKPK